MTDSGLSVFDLSDYEMYRLQSIDAVLNTDWRKTVHDILPKLDKESRQIVFERILIPRGILYDNLTKKLCHQKPASLADTLLKTPIVNNKLLQITKHMQSLLLPPADDFDLMEHADEVEALLTHFGKLELDENKNEYQTAQLIREAFLYDLASWIDQLTITEPLGVRRLDENVIKDYFKLCFIKQQLQGWDFRAWEGQDIDSLEINGFPEIYKKAAKERRFYIVETPNYWFFVGQTPQVEQNPYSFRRFLFEDLSKDGKYIYLTHVAVNRQHYNDPTHQKKTIYELSRLFTIERSVSDEVKKFVQANKDFVNKYLIPLLRKPLAADGRDANTLLTERLVDFEKQFAVLILNKMPKIMKFALRQMSDLDFLYHNLDSLLKQMIDATEDFKLQPLANYNDEPQKMVMRLTALRLLLRKTRPMLTNPSLNDEQKQQLIDQPLILLHTSLEKAEEQEAYITELKQKLAEYQSGQKNGSLLSIFKRNRAPQYTMAELQEADHEARETLYIDIVRIAKQQRSLVTFMEYDCQLMTDEEHRHYAFPDGEWGLTRLPKLFRLPQDRVQLQISNVRRTLDRDIFKSQQEW
ncbi:hypothetical protein ACF3N0_04975 [Moraxella atlantae]|uniref:hypothetical protein n=1 Tax=Faucicola atlantae TaxID=34059 RepID=UPI00375367CB